MDSRSPLRTLQVYGRLQLLQLRIQLEYEADFWIGILAVALLHVSGLVFLTVLFNRIPEIAGWSLWEIAFLYGMSLVPRGLVMLLGNGQWRLRHLVNSGEFDRLLLRPVSPALQVVTQHAEAEGLGSILLGTAVLGYAARQLELAWGVGEFLLLGATIVSGAILLGAVIFAASCIVFWEPAADSSFPHFVQELADLVKYPVTIYHRLLQYALTWLLPFAFLSYYPGSVLLGRSDANLVLGYAAPLAGLAMLFVAALIWRISLARYQGTGH